ncbi:ATP-binding cassette domain-containing protein [Streptomyces mirabilis]|uniref:ATP-binding cassette domain-containing protein n=1 Tax=Streptomyces mirabilis TaxID=68239 RepID=UPI00368C9CB2
MTTPQSAITVTGLCKAYGDKVVLDGIDLEVAAGTIFSLLGPNGAGKTTAVEILATLIKADAGDIRVAGKDVVRDPDGVRGAISVTGQFASVDNLLTGRENLIMMADLHHLGRREGRRRADELLEQFDLVDARSQRALSYSGGMRRRLDLAMTLVRRPSVIFLDEPTTGLDPRSRHAMWGVIRNLVADGVTIFLTTQYLEEADQLADLIAVLDQGRLVAQGTATELKRRVPGSYVRLEFGEQHQLDMALDVLGEARRDADALALQVPNDGSVGALRALLERLDEHAVDVAELTVHTPDLDDVFLALTTPPRRQKETVR